MAKNKTTHSASENSEETKSNLSENVVRALAQSEEFKIRGENTKALQVAQKILEKDPSCVQAAEEVADNLLSLGRDDEAKKAAQFAYSINSKSYIANYILGFTGLDTDSRASEYLTNANESCPNNPEILRCLGWALFYLGKEYEGIATLERALNLRADDPLILCDLGVCLLHQNVYEKSVKLFERALALEPNNVRALDCLEAAKEIGNQMKEELSKIPKELRKMV